MSTHSRPASTSPDPKEKPSHHHHHLHHHNEKLPEEPVVPWFPSPMEGWNEDTQNFSPRHEASTIELFFDLWFVANLATFTQYHAITNRYNFWSYIAFFIVLWSSWFHVVCFDARFTSDSVWERACKTVHFCAFAAFALAGYKFMPVAKNVQSATPHWIYRVLCFAILLSRACLAFQYLVATIMCASRKHRRHGLTLPLALNALLFLAIAGVFGGIFGAFHAVDKNLTGVLIGVYVTLLVEWIGTLVISMSWRKLSFTATHISERLGLLGLIIIGEGVIGTTKTIARTMGKNGPTVGASAQIFCIVLLLVFMWILYFDKVPRYRFGAVKQQVWMSLHLFLHLGILGVVEGAQQLAQARYIYYSSEIMIRKAMDSCITKHLNGSALASSLTDNINYFKLNESARGTLALHYVWEQVYLLGNTSDVCSPANVTASAGNALNGLPLSFYDFTFHGIGAMFQAFDIDIPPEDGSFSSLGIALRSWIVVYTYFWSAIMLILACYTITALLAEVDDRGQWRAPRHYVRLPILSRAAMIIMAAVLLALGITSAPLYLFVQNYIASSWVLPTVVLAFWVICMSDRVEKLWVKRRDGKAKYQSVQREEGEVDRDEVDAGGLRRRGTNLYGYPAN